MCGRVMQIRRKGSRFEALFGSPLLRAMLHSSLRANLAPGSGS
jgi:hypothetical protein